jgi:NitT/TauT family transport system substrate-binding protein
MARFLRTRRYLILLTFILTAVMRIALIFGALVAFSNAARSADATGQAATPFKLTVQLDWVAEPEHGGIYQAAARGFFAAEGLDVTIVPGGPNAFVVQKIATGQAQIGQGDSTDILQKIATGLPVLSVAAVFQDDPSGLLVSAASNVRRFEDLQGKTIIARPDWTFLKYLEKKLRYHRQRRPPKLFCRRFSRHKRRHSTRLLHRRTVPHRESRWRQTPLPFHLGRRLPRLRGAFH